MKQAKVACIRLRQRRDQQRRLWLMLAVLPVAVLLLCTLPVIAAHAANPSFKIVSQKLGSSVSSLVQLKTRTNGPEIGRAGTGGHLHVLMDGGGCLV